MRRFDALPFLLLLLTLGLAGGADTAGAQVRLPATGALSGSLDSNVSTFGDEFLNFPSILLPQPPPTGTVLSGWLEVRFLPPRDGKAEFLLSFGGAGTDHTLTFGGGQEYDFFTNRMRPGPFDNVGLGVLDLATGEIDELQLAVRISATSPVRINQVNRLPFGLNAFFPPPDLGLPLPPLPPDFLAQSAAFDYDSAGNIVGFRFFGKTFLPAGLLAPLNPQLGLFPLFSFGPGGQVYFANPDRCPDGSTPETCPNDETDPDGIAVGPDAILHPFFVFESHDLRPVTFEPVDPTCSLFALADGAVTGEIGGRLYQAGGVDESGRASGEVQVYDPKTGLWAPGPSMPVPVVDAQGAAIGSRLYVVGGRERLGGPATTRLQILDTTTGLWSIGPPAPQPLARATSAVVGDLLYLLGGKTNRPNGSPAGNLRFTAVAQAFDPASGSWVAFPALSPEGFPLFLEAPSAATFGSDIYLLGGLGINGATSPRVLLLDTFTLRFSEAPSLPHGVYDAMAGVVGTRLFLAGGRQVAGGPSDGGLHVFEIARGAWLDGLEAPMAVADAGVAVVDGALHLLGGRSQSFFDPPPGAPTRAVQIYDPARGWRLCGDQPFYQSASVLSTASLSVGAPTLAPGSQASIFGWNLGPEVFPLPFPTAPTELGGVRVLVDGTPAPILAIYPNRVDFQVPWDAAPGPTQLRLVNAAARHQAPPVTVGIAPASPGIFVQSCGEPFSRPYLDRASALACHPDGTLNYAWNAAAPGEVVVVQMTGLGAVEPPIASGARAPAQGAPAAVVLPEVTIATGPGESVPVEVLSATLAPGEIGVFDVAIRVPQNARTGNRVEVRASSGGVTSNRAMVSIGGASTAQPLPCLRDSNPEVRLCLAPALDFDL